MKSNFEGRWLKIDIYTKLNLKTKSKIYFKWYIRPRLAVIKDFIRRQGGAWEKSSGFLKKTLDKRRKVIPVPVAYVSGTALRLIKSLIYEVVNFLIRVVMLVVNKRLKKVKYYEISEWKITI